MTAGTHDAGTRTATRHTRDAPARWDTASSTGRTASRRRPGRPRWQRRYARWVIAGDVISLALAACSYAVWGGSTLADVAGLGTGVAALAAVCIGAARAWDPTVLGDGSTEFARLLNGIAACAVVAALAGLALEMPSMRPWVFGFLPVATVLALTSRLGLRKGLHQLRWSGRAMTTVLAVGTPESIGSLVERTRRVPSYGMSIVAACTPAGTGPDGSPAIDGVPVVGDLDDVARHVADCSVDTVSVAQTPGWSPTRLQQLAWDLEGSGTTLVVDPGLMEIAGPRLHVASIDGLPLLRLTHPRFTGFSWLLKGLVDRGVSLLLLILVLPVLIVIAVAVRTDGGPALFRQARVGLDGRTFSMVKFRSMCVGAEARLAEVAAANVGTGVLFKVREDPRVTRVGAVLRKYSLDELPQLLNVLGGSMSLVGPRPPLPQEVARYGRDARRRLLVKPGITGLWQVSGRSDLSWTESVRLDLRYVENWSLALDARILLRTVRAVLWSEGAY